MDFRRLLEFTGSLLLAGAVSLHAQQPDTLKFRISSPVGERTSQFGRSVAVAGAYAVVGTPYDDLVKEDAGVVKIFSSTTGALLHVLANPSPERNDRFGVAVAISGNRVVVGAEYDNTGATAAGSVYVYDLAGTNPTFPVHTINNPSPAASDGFGHAVAIDGTRVVVGANRDANFVGRAFAYDLAGATPTVPTVTLNNPTPNTNDQFGCSVAISGNRVVVGAMWDDGATGIPDVGRVFIFDLSNATPSVAVYTLNDPHSVGDTTGVSAYDAFGSSVSISGTRVVVGSPNDDTGAAGVGTAYIYDLAGTTPTAVWATVANPSPESYDNFGSAVAVSGTRVIVGADDDDAVGTDSGTAYVYDLTAGRPLPAPLVLNHPLPARSDFFGAAVAISGTRAVVGAPGVDAGSVDAGKAFVFDVGASTPATPTATLSDPGAPNARDHFGVSIGFSGSLMMVSKPFDDTVATNAGSILVYNLASATPTVPLAVLRHPTPATDVRLGFAAAISGTWVAVTAAQGVYIFDVAGPTPTVPMMLVPNPTPSGGDSFGNALAMSGSLLVVGDRADNAGAPQAGSAYVFDLASPTPSTPIATLNNPFPVADDGFGYNVAISGTRVAVTAPYTDDPVRSSGRAYVYDLAGAAPTVPVVIINNPIPGEDEVFGISLAISGTRVVIGSYLDRWTNQGGVAYVYDVTSATPGVPAFAIDNPAPRYGAYFGEDVAISGTRVAVTAGSDHTVYVFDLAGSTPRVPVATLSRDPAAFTFGSSLAMEGTTLVVAASSEHSPITEEMGAVYVYAPSPNTPPAGGTVTVSPTTRLNAGAPLTVSFAGWAGPHAPLRYQLLLDGAVVSPSGASASRHLTSPLSPGAHTLEARISDAFGGFSSVTRTLTINTATESWRLLHFGTTEDTASTTDLADPDGDGYNNLFERIGGFVPTDAASRFELKVVTPVPVPVAGQPAQRTIIFGPILTDRAYVLQYKDALTAGTWIPLTNFSTSDSGAQRTVIDLDTTTASRFYRVEIAIP